MIETFSEKGLTEREFKLVGAKNISSYDHDGGG